MLAGAPGARGLRGSAPRRLREPALQPRGRARRIGGRHPGARRPRGGRAPGSATAAAYVCTGFACQAPVSDPAALRAALDRADDHRARLRRAIPRAPRALRSSGAPGTPRGDLATARAGGADRALRARRRPRGLERGARAHPHARRTSPPSTRRHDEDFQQLDPDTYTCRDSALAARLAAGGLVDLAAAVADGRLVQRLRAPAAARAPRRGGPRDGLLPLQQRRRRRAGASRPAALRRILIVDWDLHHGNGTQNSFWEDPNVLYFSTHQFPFYPGTGAIDETGGGAGRGATVNVPVARRDGRRGVPGGLRPRPAAGRARVRPGDRARVGRLRRGRRRPARRDARHPRRIRADDGAARDLRGGRVVLALEGGYDLEAISKSAAACLRVLLGEAPPARASVAPSAAASAILDAVSAARRSAGRGTARA